ncbi:MAG: hypothetical protein HOV81_18715 [Kofleriaceae bacterium]|nr:hypothetical protein [Kofleriaceae bacterium]
MRFVGFLVLLAACRPPGYGKEDKPDAAVETGDGSTGSADAAIDSPPAATCEHAFRLDGHGTDSSVWLTGSFVAWASTPQAGAVAFSQGTDGGWTGSYAFEAGTHQYKLIVNGNDWILDPTNPNTADDGMGHTNNVYVCAP